MGNNVEIKGLNRFLRDLRHAPKELSAELRTRAQAIAEPIAEDARNRASNAQQEMVAPSIRAVKDRIPVIKAGGGKALKSSTKRRKKPKAGQVFFGADFGSDSLRQFLPKKKGGQMIFKAVKGNRDNYADQYFEAVEDVFKGRA